MRAEVTANTHPPVPYPSYSLDTLHPTMVYPTIPPSAHAEIVDNFFVIRPAETGQIFDPDITVCETDQLPMDDLFYRSGYRSGTKIGPIGGHQRKVWVNKAGEILHYEILQYPIMRARAVSLLAYLMENIPFSERSLLDQNPNRLLPICCMTRDKGLSLIVNENMFFFLSPDGAGINMGRPLPQGYEFNLRGQWDQDYRFRLNLHSEPSFFEFVEATVPVNPKKGRQRFVAVVGGVRFAGDDFDHMDSLILDALSQKGKDKDHAIRGVVSTYLRFEEVDPDKELQD